MAYDEALASRVRKVLEKRRHVAEQRMFGGIAFLLHGNMFCGVLERELVLRLGEEGVAQALREPYTRPMDFTGKPMKTMIYLESKGVESDDRLREWIDRALLFARLLPRKERP
jgi:TfoX/Sxy family transcriptional regulator of competence genes